MKPNYRKWRKAKNKPFQIGLFIRTEEGRVIECCIDEATGEMKAKAFELLTKLTY